MAIGKTNAKTSSGSAKLQSGKSASAGLSPKVIYADSGYDGLKDLTINAIGLDNPTINLDFSKGNQTVFTQDGYYADTITVTKPENFLASNIKKGEVIAGITGIYEGTGEKPTQTKTVEFNPGSADSITIAPDEGYVLSGVEVGKPVTMIPSNIKSGVNIGGVVGTYEASGGYPSFTTILEVSSFDVLDGEVLLQYLINNDEVTNGWQTISSVDTIELHDVYAIKFKITATCSNSNTNRIISINNNTTKLVDIMQLPATTDEFTMETANFAILENTTLTINVSQS